jgi:hypothetical protein
MLSKSYLKVINISVSLLFFLLSIFPFIFFNRFPDQSIFTSEIILCSYFFILFKKNKRAYLFYLYPVIIYAISLFYTTNFLTLGDGGSYISVSDELFEQVETGGLVNTFLNNWEAGYDYFLFYWHLVGFFPIRWIPLSLKEDGLQDISFFYFQSFSHLFLCSILVFLNRLWNTIPAKYEISFFLFAIISPTFFELQTAPTRHLFTFFSVALFYIASVGLRQGFSFFKLVCLTLSIIFTILGKPAYLILFFLFASTFAYNYLNREYKVIAAILFGFIIFFYGTIFYETYNSYDKMFGNMGTTKVQAEGLGIFKPLLKLLAALLGAFPWYKAIEISNEVFGGNLILFVLHIFSAIFGVWVFTRFFYFRDKLFSIDKDLSSLLLFGLIMSVSIFAGATGFHGYLSIFFPFFAPLLVVKQNNISLLIPSIALLILNLIMLFL